MRPSIMFFGGPSHGTRIPLSANTLIEKSITVAVLPVYNKVVKWTEEPAPIGPKIKFARYDFMHIAGMFRLGVEIRLIYVFAGMLEE